MFDSIPNPFKDDWKDFDREEFEQDVLDIIEDLYKAKDIFSIYEIRADIADYFGELIMLHIYRLKDEIEVVPIKDLPDYMIEEMDLTAGKDTYLPVDVIENIYSTEEYASLFEKAKKNATNKKKKNDWLID